MKKGIYVGIKIAAIVSALMVVLIALNQEVQTSNQKAETQDQISQLNVALVNKDKGVSANGKDVNLGSNYIKKLKKIQIINGLLLVVVLPKMA